jgi:hypothetical protein
MIDNCFEMVEDYNLRGGLGANHDRKTTAEPAIGRDTRPDNPSTPGTENAVRRSVVRVRVISFWSSEREPLLAVRRGS